MLVMGYHPDPANSLIKQSGTDLARQAPDVSSVLYSPDGIAGTRSVWQLGLG